MVLAQLLPHLGINLGSDELTTTVSTLLTLGGALWALVRRYRVGDINIAGVRTI